MPESTTKKERVIYDNGNESVVLFEIDIEETQKKFNMTSSQKEEFKKLVEELELVQVCPEESWEDILSED